jgi:polyhydroxybutyrate depolymerase
MRRVASALVIMLIAGACSSSPKSSPARATTTTATGTTVPRATPSAGCRRPAPKPGVLERTMSSRGVERKYQVIVPARYDGRKPMPLVFALHALTVPYVVVPALSGFPDMAKRYDFITAVPSGRLDGATPYWLAAPSDDNYDVEFLGALLDRLVADFCIDSARVYSTGISNGAQMSSLLACRMPDRITAVAPVAGVEFYDSCRGRPVPVIAFHGLKDPIVTYVGGGLNAARIADVDYWKGKRPKGLAVHHGVDAAMRTWAAHNGCDAEPVEERVSPHVRRRTWQHCEAATVLYVIEDGGHALPGRPVPQFESAFGKATTEIDAPTLMFRFFLGAPTRPR